MNLLGYDPAEVTENVAEESGIKVQEPEPVLSVSQNPVNPGLGSLDNTMEKDAAFDAIASSNQAKNEAEEDEGEPFAVETGSGKVGLLNRTLLTGNIELAVEIW